MIARERILEWYDPVPGGLAAVGGLENIKACANTGPLCLLAREIQFPRLRFLLVAGGSINGSRCFAQPAGSRLSSWCVGLRLCSVPLGKLT